MSLSLGFQQYVYNLCCYLIIKYIKLITFKDVNKIRNEKQKLQLTPQKYKESQEITMNNYAPIKQTSLVAQMVKHLPTMLETWV